MAVNDCVSGSRSVREVPHAATGNQAIPSYLVDQYWWAYLHPAAIAFFDHPWVVNLILWGNFGRLSSLAFEALGPAPLAGRTLQIACVYGDLTPRLARRLDPSAVLDVIDVVPQQLINLRRKLEPESRVALRLCNSAELGGADGRYDQALIFFLLHEQPEAVRRATLSEAVRVVRPGGRVVIVDYHRPSRWNPLRYLMLPVLRWLEPFAPDLWQHELEAWLPARRVRILQQRLLCGRLYQSLVLIVDPLPHACGHAQPGPSGTTGAAAAPD